MQTTNESFIAEVLEYKAVKRADIKSIPFVFEYVAYPAYQLIDILEVIPDADFYITQDNWRGDLYAMTIKATGAFVCPTKWDGLMQKTEL